MLNMKFVAPNMEVVRFSFMDTLFVMFDMKFGNIEFEVTLMAIGMPIPADAVDLICGMFWNMTLNTVMISIVDLIIVVIITINQDDRRAKNPITIIERLSLIGSAWDGRPVSAASAKPRILDLTVPRASPPSARGSGRGS